MLKKICGILILALSAACGGYEGSNSAADIQPYADEEQALREGLPPLDSFVDGEIGQTEQAFAAKNAGTAVQFGTRTATSALACNTSSTGQVCWVPADVTGTVANKKIQWSFTPAHNFTATEQTAVRNAVTALDNTLSAWVFEEINATAPIQIGKGTVSGASTSNNIDAFRSVAVQLPQNLSEGAGVVGAYQFGTSIIAIDIADINTRGAAEEAKVAGDQGETGKLRTHAILSAFMAAVGAGTRDDASSDNTYHDRTLKFPGPLFRPLNSAGTDCQLEAFDHFENGSFSLQTPACGS